MDVSAEITGIKYLPFLCPSLKIYDIDQLEEALSKNGTFVLNVEDGKQLAISWWVSPKRTRSYPYARVYNSLSFPGKKVTIIPFVKDEGEEGDRDFLQWDTISLMSLLGVYTIISYYKYAERSPVFKHKITNQRFDVEHLIEEIYQLLAYQSDALHWNLVQLGKIGLIMAKALDTYSEISKRLGVEMHSESTAEKRAKDLIKSRESFMKFSREVARKAKRREAITIQPKEKLAGSNATLTIKNYLGGYYFLTVDEMYIKDEKVYLVEGKHSNKNVIPSLEDIKDGLLRMILFSNFKNVKIGNKQFPVICVLKLTSDLNFSPKLIKMSQKRHLTMLKKEAEVNGFEVFINNIDLKKMEF
ncbi:MAG: hypothetical protein N2246_04475 [Candidatus Sumerlaeia bacterium]|nr:hypothetical protein [Candidatus Sumerlaeia bacterium]